MIEIKTAFKNFFYTYVISEFVQICLISMKDKIMANIRLLTNTFEDQMLNWVKVIVFITSGTT
jgi:hypothetical protein